MVLGSVYITAPAAAAAMGLYFFGKNISNTHGGEYGRTVAPAAKLAAKEKKDGIGRSGNAPELAPQFDGLHCFETIVRR